jgi:hypothetical protein
MAQIIYNQNTHNIIITYQQKHFFSEYNNNNGLDRVVHKNGRHPSLRHCYQDHLKV